MKKIKLFDVYEENQIVKERFFQRLETLYDASEFTLGYHEGPVEQLELLFAQYCGRKYAIAVNSGSFALDAASYLLDLKPGDEVIVPANTFLATATMPSLHQATIVEADIDPDTWNICPQSVEQAITEKTKAIFAVNMYGNPCNYEGLRKFGVPIVEDAAHSHGATYRGEMSGNLGLFSAFSFFPTKVFGGIGDGGMLLFDKEDDEKVVRAYRNAGQEKPHYAIVPSLVGRMAVVQAAFLVEKWSIFEQLLAHRRKIAHIYDSYFKDSVVQPQKIEEGCQSAYFAYVISVPQREKVCEMLTLREIPWTIQYRYLLHEQPFWNRISSRTIQTPVAQQIIQQMISIPMNMSISEQQARYIAENVIDCVERV